MRPDFEARLQAVAAGAGYVLFVTADPVRNTRTALQQLAHDAVELVFVWEPHTPPGGFVKRVEAANSRGRVVAIEAQVDVDALEEARVWCDLAPVVRQARVGDPEPGTMIEAVFERGFSASTWSSPTKR